MTVDASAIVFVALGASLLPTAISALVARSIKGMDTAVDKLEARIEKMDSKFDRLASQDTKTEIELVELRARVTTLEFFVFRGPPPTGQIPDSRTGSNS